MSVELSPPELGFRRPFDREVTEVLRLTNTNSSPLAFKVKTTAPKQYCVRPNSGVIAPHGATEVQVLLQAMREEPPLDAKCRDKFLVQTVAIGEDQDPNVATLWQTVEKTAKSSIQERKIRVNFLAPSGTSTNGVTSQDEPPAYSSPTPAFGSPAPASDSKPRNSSTLLSAQTTVSKAAEASGVTGAVAAISNAVPTSGEELKQQLAAAQAQIQQLSSQIQDPQVRQRKVQEASDKVQTVVQQTNESGVPLQIVAALCLLSFLIAYLFF